MNPGLMDVPEDVSDYEKSLYMDWNADLMSVSPSLAPDSGGLSVLPEPSAPPPLGDPNRESTLGPFNPLVAPRGGVE